MEEMLFILTKIITDNDKPNLTADQSWHVIYCLQEHFGMLDDRFEKCRECGDIYDSDNGGLTIDCDSTHLVENEDYEEVEKEYKESDYGNYCEDCEPN